MDEGDLVNYQGVIFSRPLISTVQADGEILTKIRSTWPFDFFPDELIVDRHKISLVRRPFFLSTRVVSLAFEDISNVIIENSVVFASLEIDHKIFGMPPLNIRYLKRGEANELKRLLLGMVIAKKEGNKEMFTLSNSELIEKAKNLGQARRN